MKPVIIKLLVFFCLFIFEQNVQAQNIIDTANNKKVKNIVARVGVGMSRHFITEIGIAYMASNFVNHKQFGLNTTNFIYYLSYETMTPFKKPIVSAYKVGVEMVNVGHVTSAAALELAYYMKDTISSFTIIPKLGLPLVNGMLSYGFAMYFEPSMRKEIGRHRFSITYCFNRKSNKAFHAMLAKK